MPEAERPDARTEEQEVASGRTAETPLVVLSSVIIAVAAVVLVALAIVVLAYVLA